VSWVNRAEFWGLMAEEFAWRSVNYEDGKVTWNEPEPGKPLQNPPWAGSVSDFLGTRRFLLWAIALWRGIWWVSASSSRECFPAKSLTGQKADGSAETGALRPKQKIDTARFI